jgi:hypothetical protein
MTDEYLLYLDIGQKINDAEEGQMFGKPCFKVKGKAFVCFFENCMVFKLNGQENSEALSINGAQLFDPSGKKRPMKEWVQVPLNSSYNWKKFAVASFNYVKT